MPTLLVITCSKLQGDNDIRVGVGCLSEPPDDESDGQENALQSPMHAVISIRARNAPRYVACVAQLRERSTWRATGTLVTTSNMCPELPVDPLSCRDVLVERFFCSGQSVRPV